MAAPIKFFSRNLSTKMRNLAKLKDNSLPRPQYGGRHTVALMPGDGIGPELMNHVKEVFRYAGVPVDFETIPLNKDNSNDPTALEHALLAIKRNRIALKGNLVTPVESQDQTLLSRNVILRSELDLFANVIWCKSVENVPNRHGDIDIIIIRENTEGEYSQLEYETVTGVVESMKIITRYKSMRIARYGFEFAKKHGRKKVTAVHKANIMKLGDGMFLECCKEVSKDYPDIEFEGMIVDNCSMQMVSRPSQFDVMLLPNLYGNIIANIATGIVGGPGIVSGANMGEDYAVFELGTRNTGNSIAGKNIANPCAMLLASAELLDHIGLLERGKIIRNAVYKVLTEDQIHTPDLGGHATTTDMIQAIITRIEASEYSWF